MDIEQKKKIQQITVTVLKRWHEANTIFNNKYVFAKNIYIFSTNIIHCLC